jgi:hypothetical protein
MLIYKFVQIIPDDSVLSDRIACPIVPPNHNVLSLNIVNKQDNCKPTLEPGSEHSKRYIPQIQSIFKNYLQLIITLSFHRIIERHSIKLYYFKIKPSFILFCRSHDTGKG